MKSLRSFVGRSHSVTTRLIPFFGRILLAEIKPLELNQRKPIEHLPMFKPSTMTTALKDCLNVAIRRGLLQSKPPSKVPLPNPQNKRDRVLTAEEWRRLYRAAKVHLRPVLLAAYQVGQRFSEIVGLTWDRIDVKRGFITFRSMDTKTKTARQVPMAPGQNDITATESDTESCHKAGLHV